RHPNPCVLQLRAWAGSVASPYAGGSGRLAAVVVSVRLPSAPAPVCFAPRERGCAGRRPLLESALFGAWRSLVARFNGVEEVVGSNPAARTDLSIQDANAALMSRRFAS